MRERKDKIRLDWISYTYLFEIDVAIRQKCSNRDYTNEGKETPEI
jgi:hypothetical protein